MDPEISLGVALAVGTVVVAIHQNATPTSADMRTLDPDNEDISSSERAATWMSAGIVAGISLLARDPMIFIVGGAITVGMAWWTRHDNFIMPQVSRLMTPGADVPSAPSTDVDSMATQPYEAFANAGVSDFIR